MSILLEPVSRIFAPAPVVITRATIVGGLDGISLVFRGKRISSVGGSNDFSHRMYRKYSYRKLDALLRYVYVSLTQERELDGYAIATPNSSVQDILHNHLFFEKNRVSPETFDLPTALEKGAEMYELQRDFNLRSNLNGTTSCGSIILKEGGDLGEFRAAIVQKLRDHLESGSFRDICWMLRSA